MYNLKVHPEDFQFIVEAIKLRTISLVSSLERQRDEIVKDMVKDQTNDIVQEAIKTGVIKRGRPAKK